MKYILMLALSIFMSFAYAESPFETPPGLNKQGGNAKQEQQQQQQQKQAQQQAQGQAQGQAQQAISEGSTSASNSSIDITTDTDVSTSNNYKADASTAAAVFPQNCQEGTSGQTVSAGGSTVFESAMCQSLKMAEVHQAYWKMYSEMGDTEQAEMHKKYMDEYIAKASESADFHYYPKNVGSFFLEILPIGLIALFL